MSLTLRFHLAAFVFLLSPLAFAVTANELPPARWGADSWGISSTNEYFTTNANYYQKRGEYNRLLSGNNFTNFSSRLRGRYGFTQRFAAFAGFGFSFSRAVDLNIEKTNSGVNDLFAGANYILWQRNGFRFIPEIQFGYPLDPVGATQTNPLTSEGVWYARGGLFIIKPWRHFRATAFGGFWYPGEGLAARLTYEFTGEIPLGDVFTIGGGINGYEAVSNDSRNELERQATTTRANAGSYRFHSYNPALIEARAWIGLSPLPGLMLRGGYAKTIDGLRAPEGQSILFSLAYNLPGRAPAGTSTRPVGPTQPTLDETAEQFEVDVESTDQSFFEEAESPKPRPTRKRNALDEAEKTLERRSR